MMKQVQKGFTLIELMIVVAIIGILAAIAIPAYQDYTIRAQITEGLNVVGGVKVGVEEFVMQEGRWPTAIGVDPAADELDVDVPSGKYVAGVVLSNGTIQVTMGRDANAAISGANNRVDLQPYFSAGNGQGNIMWHCGRAAAPNVATATATPNDGAGAASTANATTILGKYLPSACRP